MLNALRPLTEECVPWPLLIKTANTNDLGKQAEPEQLNTKQHFHLVHYSNNDLHRRIIFGLRCAQNIDVFVRVERI